LIQSSGTTAVSNNTHHAHTATSSFNDVSTGKRFQAGGVFLSGLALLALLISAIPAGGQSTRHERRESNANRKRRIERTIAETYSHRYEVGGGGGFLRFRSGQYQQQDNQISFWASTLYALNPKLGIQADIRGGYGNAKVTNPLPSGNNLGYNPKISEYNFMAGPSFRVVRKEKFSASVFAEGGYGLGKFDGDSKGLNAHDIGVWTGNNAASFSAGVHLDYNLYPNLAFRVTPNYLGTTFGSTVQNSKGVNAGIVYRFGTIK
jgi:hypothetical protein